MAMPAPRLTRHAPTRSRFGNVCEIDSVTCLETGPVAFCGLMPSVKRAAVQQPPRMSPDEKRLARDWHFEHGRTAEDIARTLQRHPSSIGRLLAQKKKPKPVGRPRPELM